MRKRSKRKLNWGPLLVVLLVVNLAAGVAYSQLTSLGKVRIQGAAPFDRTRLEEQMAALANVPCNQINPRKVESNALNIPEALDADFLRNVFGRGLLKITYRKPVAKVEGVRSALMDENGVVYLSRQDPRGLPTLRLPPESLGTNLALMLSWPAGDLAHLCQEMPKEIVAEKAVFELQPKGELCLNNGQTGRIVFGSAAQLDEKLGRLKTLLAQNPRLLSEISELNLTAPDRPSFRPLAVEHKP